MAPRLRATTAKIGIGNSHSGTTAPILAGGNYDKKDIDDTFSHDNFVRSPMQQAGWISRAFFLWVSPLVRMGHDKTVGQHLRSAAPAHTC